MIGFVVKLVMMFNQRIVLPDGPSLTVKNIEQCEREGYVASINEHLSEAKNKINNFSSNEMVIVISILLQVLHSKI